MKEFSIMYQINEMKNYYDMDKYRLIDIYLTVNNLPIGCFKLSNIVYILSSEILFYTKIYRLVIIDDRGDIYSCDSEREFKKDI